MGKLPAEKIRIEDLSLVERYEALVHFMRANQITRLDVIFIAYDEHNDFSGLELTTPWVDAEPARHAEHVKRVIHLPVASEMNPCEGGPIKPFSSEFQDFARSLIRYIDPHFDSDCGSRGAVKLLSDGTLMARQSKAHMPGAREDTSINPGHFHFYPEREYQCLTLPGG